MIRIRKQVVLIATDSTSTQEAWDKAILSKMKIQCMMYNERHNVS